MKNRTLRDRALEAYAEEKAAYEEMLEENRQRERKKLGADVKQFFNCDVAEYRTDDEIRREVAVVEDGLEFALGTAGYPCLVVVCPSCGKRWLSRYVTGLSDLGRVLSEDDPTCDHCRFSRFRSQSEAESPAERLYHALCDFLGLEVHD